MLAEKKMLSSAPFLEVGWGLGRGAAGMGCYLAGWRFPTKMLKGNSQKRIRDNDSNNFLGAALTGKKIDFELE